MSIKWTNDLLSRVSASRAKGNTWSVVAEEVAELTGEVLAAAHVRSAYLYHCKETDASIELTPAVLVAQRRSQVAAAAAKRSTRKLADGIINQQDFLYAIQDVVRGLKKQPKVKVIKPTAKSKGIHMTAELLFSDLQIGKIMPNYNTDIARRRIQAYVEAALFKIAQHQKSGYVFDKIVLAFLGDIIESDKKHENSARATDTSTAEQIKHAIEYIYSLLIVPLAKLGIPMDVVCVTGNHDHDGHGLAQYCPGKNHLSYPLYHALRMLSEVAGFSHLKFSIPEGAFWIHNIYNHNILYEHGVGISTAESSMFKRRAERSQQIGKGITYFRMGDKHNISRFNEDTLVVNGAFFGGDIGGNDYSGINGYSSQPCQVMFFHCPRTEDNRLPIYDSFVIQLSHIL